MSLYHEIPFLRNVVLTDLVSNVIPNSEALMGPTLLPLQDVPTRQTEWETIVGGRNIAPIVAWDAQSPLVAHPGIERRTAQCLDIREKFALNDADLLFLRFPGQRESQRGRDIVTDQLAKMKGDVENRIEKMRWDAILTGAISVSDTVDGQLIAVTYDYDIPAGQYIDATDASGGAVWTDQTNADARLNFEAAAQKILSDTGQTVTTALMNRNTRALINHMAKIRTDLQYTDGRADLVRNANITEVLNNIRLVTYDQGYKLDVNWTGAYNFFIPDNKVIFHVGARVGGEKFGDVAMAPTVLADGTRATGIWAEQWTSPDPTREYLRVGAIAIPRIFHRDWFVVLSTNA